MANWYISKGASGSNNGTDWANAWTELDQINWGKVSSGDTIWLDGGRTKKVYTKTLRIGKSGSSRNNRIKIKRSEENGRNGYVVIFGGRNNELPHANITTHRWRESGNGQSASGIHMRSFSNIEVDGGIPRGITIHGWNNAGIDSYGDNGGGHRFANMEIYSNGTIQTVSGRYKTDKAGIRLAGKHVLIERCIILDNGQDAIQNVGGQRPDNALIRHCFLANTKAHVDLPHFTWNYNRHPDGVQVYTGGENIVIEDCLIMGMWHGLILGDAHGNFNNGKVRRITFIDNATAIRWHGRATARNNQVEDIVIKKWRWYPNDNGVGYPNGGNYYLKGDNNKHNRFLITGHGAFSIYGSGNQWSNMYTDGSLDHKVPNAKTINPNFVNPGPVGNRGENIGHGWQTRDIKIRNSSIDITMTYSGPLDFLRKQSGKNYGVYPESIHANVDNGNDNERPIIVENPILQNLSSVSAKVNETLNFQIEATHPTGATVTFSADGLPPNVTINSAGLLTGKPTVAGKFSVSITANGGGGSTHGTFLIEVDPIEEGDGEPINRSPIFVNPGPQSSWIGDFTQLALQVTDPDKDSIKFSAEGLPSGLVIDEDTGVISGTPNQNGESIVSIIATDSGGAKVSQTFSWTVAAEVIPNLTKLFQIPMQEIALQDSINLQIASSSAQSINASANNLPPGIKMNVQISQHNTMPENHAGSGQGGGLGGSLTSEKTAVDAESDGKSGDGGTEIDGTVLQTFNLGKVNGDVFTITQTIAPHPNLNPGAPTINGTSWGYTQIKCGGGDGVRFNLITVNVSQPIDQLDYRVGGISTPEEDIVAISNGGTLADVDSDHSGIVSWRNLGGLRQLSFVYKSNSSGNNAFFAPKNKVIVSAPINSVTQPYVDSRTAMINTTKTGLIGSTGAGTTQVYNLGDVLGSNLTLTQVIEGAPQANNSGNPFLIGLVSGYSEFSAGGDSGLRTNRVRIFSNRPFKDLVWAIHGIKNDSEVEGVSFISDKGTVSGLGNHSTGMVKWSNLPEGTTEVYFDVVSDSSGNNAGFGPIGDILLHAGGAQTDSCQIRLIGTTTAKGTFECLIDIDDSTGSVGQVPVQFEVS
ncbi:MAG: Ig domain-containing protein [Anaerolineae bacterium]